MALHSFVFCEPPSTFRIQLLVRQSLSLLEEMHEKDLPGYTAESTYKERLPKNRKALRYHDVSG
jgi:hypothetical protein